jgi:hypothetical protein
MYAPIDVHELFWPQDVERFQCADTMNQVVGDFVFVAMLLRSSSALTSRFRHALRFRRQLMVFNWATDSK